MNINYCKQKSEEWWALKVAKISGTRFGQATSGRKNRLIYDLLNERIQGYIERDDFETDDMRFGNEQEPLAREEIIKVTGVQFEEVGAILSDFSDMHMASPDGLFEGIVLEIKSTMSGAIHMQRFFEGPETAHMPQIINYFAVSDEVKEVWWYSWNPYCEIKKLVKWVYTRETIIGKSSINDLVIEGRKDIAKIEAELIEKEQSFIF